jgi:tetratricopeptide (TPR) repeat protein
MQISAKKIPNVQARQVRARPKQTQLDQPTSPLVGASDVAAWMAILLATVVAYWPALHGGLLWDDTSHVTSPVLQSLHGLWRIWFKLGATQQYYPLLHSSFWIEHRLWGDSVLGYHLANVTEHALAACLLVLVVRRLGLPGGWLAGLIFALHPVCVEAVAWISEQKSTLSAVFYLSSALTYLYFDQTRRRSQYFGALALFILALLTKTVTATLPAALLVVFWWQRGRLDWKRDVRPLLPWFVLGASSGLFTAWVERTFIGAEGEDFRLTLLQRVLLAGRVLCFYAGKLVWPSNLIFSYPRWQPDPTVWWQYLYPLAVLALVGALWGLVRRRGPLASFLLFAGTLFPVLGFLNVYPFRFSYVADHFQYLATLGIIVPAASTMALGIRRIPSGKAANAALLLVVPAVLGILTWRQSGMYRDNETLFRVTLEHNPGGWWAHQNMGFVLSQMPGRMPDAIAEYQTALRINPDDAGLHDSLGRLLSKIPGRSADAIAEYRTALRIQPLYAPAHNNLGIALVEIPDRLPEAIAEFQAAVRLQPTYVHAHMNLGNALSQVPGRLPDAIAEYQAALRLQPEYVPAHMNLADVLSQTPDRLPEAIAEYQAALRIKPDYAKAHNSLGYALAKMPGRLPDAIAQYQAALQLQPDYAEAHDNLGDALVQVPGRLADAVSEYQATLQIQPDNPEAHNGLGYALSQMPGKMEDAIAEFRAALLVQPDYLQARINLGNALAQMPGRRQEALAQYELVLQAKPDLENVRQLIKGLRDGK